MRSQWSRSLFVVLLMLFLASTASAATRTWTGAVDQNWSNAGNWSPAVAPLPNDTLVFPANKGALLNNDALTSVRSIQFEGGGYTLTGSALTINEGVAQLNTAGTNEVFIALTIGANQTFSCAGGSTLRFTKPINYAGLTLTTDVAAQGLLSFSATNTGNGTVTKTGDGTLYLGAAQNAAATMNVTAGKMLIDTPFNAPVSIASPGVVELGTNATFNGLTMSGGTIVPTFASNPPKKLTLSGGGVNATSSATAPAVIGENLEVNLLDGTTFYVSDGPQSDDLRVRSYITQNAGAQTAFTKKGSGRMTLEDGSAGDSSFEGTVYVQDGQLSIRDPNALGTTGRGVIVTAGTLEIDASNVPDDIWMQGGALGSATSGSILGAVTLFNDTNVPVGAGHTLGFEGVVNGAGRMLPSMPNFQTVIGLSKANTFASPLTINAGSMLIAGSQPNIDVNINGPLAGVRASGDLGVVTMTDGYLSMDTETTMTAKGLDLDGGNFTTATYNNTFTRCTVNGTVDLAGAYFSVLVYSGWAPTLGVPYTIIANDGTDPIVPFASVPEGGEVYTLGYRFQVSYKGGDGNDLTITRMPPAFSLLLSSYSVKESDGSVTVTVRRAGDYSAPASVTLQTYATNAQNQATAGADYQAQNVTLTWAGGDSDAKVVQIPITGELTIEPDEEFGVRLINPSGAVLGPPSTAPVTIRDDDSSVGFTSATYSVGEAAGSTSFVITRTGQGSALPATYVQFDTIAGTATASNDYGPIQGQVVGWTENDKAAKTVTLTLLDDNAYEGDETMTVRLSTSDALTLTTSEATVTITDNEGPQRGTLAFTPDSLSVSEGAGSVTMNVARTGGANGAVTVQYATADGTATNGSDYTSKSGLLSWGDGDSSTKTFTVDILNDSANESAEAFTIALSNPTGGAAIGGAATISISDDDAPNPGTVQLSSGSYSAKESTGKITITATRTGGSQGEIYVKWTASAGSATANDDFTAANAFFHWVDGETAPKTADVTINDDFAKEPDETIIVTLSEPTTGVVLGSPSAATLTILNDDLDGGTIELQQPQHVLESAGSMTVTVTRTGANEGPASVQISTYDDTAQAGSDYTSVSTTLNWADGDGTSRTITVPLLDDDVIENTEWFRVKLTNINGAILGNTFDVQGYIDNDDATGIVQFGATTYSVAENGVKATLTVTRTDGKTGPATVDYATMDGSAAAGSDYTAKSGTLNWAAGDGSSKTIAIDILNDSILESEEQFNVKLTNATGAGLGNADYATVKITNDDAPNPGTLQLDASSYTVNEGGSFAVNIKRVGGNNGQISFSLRAVAGTAGANDVPLFDDLLVFQDGDSGPLTYTVNTWDDSFHEGPETFTLELYDPTGGAVLGTPNKATVTITDDDNDNPGLFKLSAFNYTVAENAGNVVISVVRFDGGAGVATVQYRAQARSATTPEDFGASTGTLTWADGEQGTKTFTVPIVNDTETENYEIFDAIIANATGATLYFPNAAEVYIADDDTGTAGDLRFEASTYSVNEGAGNAVVTVKRVGGSSGPASIEYLMNDAGATSADYTAAKGNLTWADGDASPKTITIPIIDDGAAEYDEPFDVVLFNPSNASLNPEFTTRVTIKDNDSPGQLAFATNAAIVVENQGSLTVTVKRTGGSKGAASVKYQATDGSAMNGFDYTIVSGTLTWADGDASDKTISVPIVDDTDVESVENFLVILDQPTGASLVDPYVMKVTLNDNESGQPGSLQLTASTASIGEGGSAVALKVSRTGGSSGAVSVSFATADASAKAGSDYVSTTGTLLWQQGDTADKTISIPILDDAIIDAAETFTLQLSNVAGGATLGNPNAATITIDDDDLAGSLQFSSATYAASENSGSLIVSVTRSGGSAGTASVQVSTSNGSALSGSDYNSVNTTLNWGAGDAAAKTFSIPLLDDSSVEGSETLTVALSNATNASAGNPNAATITIIDDEVAPAGVVQFSSASYNANENGGTVTITVNRAGGANGVATVQYATSSGTATAGADFTGASGTLTWANGVSGAQTFIIPITNDNAYEGSESLSVQLSNASGAALGNPSTATVTINDDDAPAAGTLQLSASSFQVLENAGALTVTVTRTNGSGGTASVQYATTAGTATAGADYQTTNGSLQWADGDAASKTFTVPIINDASAESPETFTVSIGNASGASLGAPASAIVTIESEDVAPAGTVQFALASASVAENGGSVTVSVTRTGGSSGAADVQIATADGVAKAGQDFVANSATLHWNDGDGSPKTFTINILNDSTIEGEPESFTVSLSNVSGASFGNPTAMAININDDDVASPGTIQFAIASTTVAENGGSVTVSVTRAGGSYGAADVHIATADGVAKAGQDYVANSATLHWNDGDNAPKSFTILITDDAGVEGTETFNVALSNATGAVMSTPNSMSITITDDDVAPAGTLQFASATASAGEGDGTIALTVTRIGGTSGAATVKYATANGTAGGSDYSATSGTLQWADGDGGARTILIALSDDALDENDETFSVALSNATGASIAAPSAATVTIIDNDAPAAKPGFVQFAQNSAHVNEGAGTVTLSVTRTGGSDGAASVLFATSGSSAFSGSDYVAGSGTLSWASGEASTKTFQVAILNDNAVESSEAFSVQLTGVTGATLGIPAVMQVTIDDDDAPQSAQPSLSIDDAIASERDGTMTFNVHLSKPAPATKVRVRYSTSPGSATDGGDYTTTSGMLIFEEGQSAATVTVPLIDDAIEEEGETFSVMLFDAVNATVGNWSGIGTINDDDGVQPLRFAIAGSVRGANGSNYKTSLQILNPSNAPMGGQIVFGQGGAGGGGNSNTLAYELQPGELRSFGDVLASIHPDLTGLGALDIVPNGGAAPLSVMRVYNDGEEKGTWGMTEEAANGQELASGQRGILIVPADTQQYRFNVGVRTFDSAATLRVTTRNASGEVVHTVERAFGAASVSQTNAASFAEAALENDAVVEVEVLSGAAVVYGTTTDNITQDTAIAVAAPVAAANAGSHATRTIPVVASTAGSHGSFFRTSLQLHNPYAFAQSVTLRYGSQELQLALQPRETRSLADLVAALGSAGIGSVDVESTGGVPVSAIRVFNDGGSLGTSGLAEPLAGESYLLRKGDRAALLPPADLEKFRFNVGVRAFGDGATLRVTCGAAAPVERAYDTNQFGQIGASDFCGSALTAAPLRIEVTAGSAIVYGATTDNITQDPNMQFAQKY